MLGVLCSAPQKKEKPDPDRDNAARGPDVPDGERITPRDIPPTTLWTVSVGYRYQNAARLFVGTVSQKLPSGPQLQNVLRLFDVSVERQLNQRFSVSASIPLQMALRNQNYVPTGRFRVNGFGDMTVGGRGWIFKTGAEHGGNIAIGGSLKAPTGKADATGVGLNARSGLVTAVADQSIQAGDGSWGFSLDLQAYQRVWFRTMLYLSGSYLFSPADTNGVSSGRIRFRETVNSVPDQYLLRGGLAHAVPGVPGLVVTLGGRWEGVPVRDLIGQSNGFRRPGYAISADPGLLYVRQGYTFAFNVPWAIERNLRRSVPEIENGFRDNVATFASYLITFGVSKSF